MAKVSNVKATTTTKATKATTKATKAKGTKVKAVEVVKERAGFTPTEFKAKLGKGITATLTSGGQARVTGLPGGSMSKFARWCGFNGFTKAACAAFIEKRGVVMNPTTLDCQWGSGSTEAAGGKAHHGTGSDVVVENVKAVKAELTALEG